MIPVLDADSIYKIPKNLHEKGLDDYILERFGMSPSDADFTEWDDVVAREFAERRARVKVGMVGKYTDLIDAYKSLNEALGHAGLHTNTHVDIEYIDAEDLETQGTDILATLDAILVPGGFGDRGIEGKIAAVKYARENKIPTSVFVSACIWP